MLNNPLLVDKYMNGTIPWDELLRNDIEFQLKPVLQISDPKRSIQRRYCKIFTSLLFIIVGVITITKEFLDIATAADEISKKPIKSIFSMIVSSLIIIFGIFYFVKELYAFIVNRKPHFLYKGINIDDDAITIDIDTNIEESQLTTSVFEYNTSMDDTTMSDVVVTCDNINRNITNGFIMMRRTFEKKIDEKIDFGMEYVRYLNSRSEERSYERMVLLLKAFTSNDPIEINDLEKQLRVKPKTLSFEEFQKLE